MDQSKRQIDTRKTFNVKYVVRFFDLFSYLYL